jgi:hypothetical protein
VDFIRLLTAIADQTARVGQNPADPHRDGRLMRSKISSNKSRSEVPQLRARRASFKVNTEKAWFVPGSSNGTVRRIKPNCRARFLARSTISSRQPDRADAANSSVMEYKCA